MTMIAKPSELKRRKQQLRELPAASGRAMDDRLHVASPFIRKYFLNKVYPDHWTFLLGEIALWSFVMLLLTGTFLALFFDPSMQETVYDGSYTALSGVEMSRAYASTLNISFDVRGGLLIRQMHHWAALLFLASIVVHMLRIFFTGAFRKPREINWVIGVIMFWLAFLMGFTGYSLPDDALSGTGLRIAHAIILSFPVIGTWVASAFFDGDFPGQVIIFRAYILHVFLLPLTVLALITVHIGIMFKQKHTQWSLPGRSNRNVVGERYFPRYLAKQTAFLLVVFSVITLLAGLFQINPVWLFGPYKAAVVSFASQPDWYVLFLEGATRLFPAWDITFSLFGQHFTIPSMFWPAGLFFGAVQVIMIAYPFIEARIRRTNTQVHNLLERPRDVPGRTAFGMAALTFYIVLTASGANDVIAKAFDIDLNATTWIGRAGVIVLPALAFFLTYRICLGLQQHDRLVLAHGVETGIIRRTADGRFYEVHQPLGDHLDYTGAPVPKKMNRIGALGPAIRGLFFPIEKPASPARPQQPTPDGQDQPGHDQPGHEQDQQPAGRS